MWSVLFGLLTIFLGVAVCFFLGLAWVCGQLGDVRSGEIFLSKAKLATVLAVCAACLGIVFLIW